MVEVLNLEVRLCTSQELYDYGVMYGHHPWYGLSHLRGFRQGNQLYIRKGCFGELALMAHEYGHVRGLKHTKWPTIMNFSGLFRWFAGGRVKRTKR